MLVTGFDVDDKDANSTSTYSVTIGDSTLSTTSINENYLDDA